MKKQRQQRWQNSEAGFSLVELLVVIAILAILIGGSVIGVNILASGDAKKAANHVNSLLSETRTSTLSVSGTWEAKIVKEKGVARIDILKNGDVVKTTKLGSRISIAYQDGTGTKVDLVDDDAIIISYMPSSGKFKSIVNSSNHSWKSTSTDTTDSTYTSYGSIIITGNSSEYVVKLWYETGRTTVE